MASNDSNDALKAAREALGQSQPQPPTKKKRPERTVFRVADGGQARRSLQPCQFRGCGSAEECR